MDLPFNSPTKSFTSTSSTTINKRTQLLNKVKRTLSKSTYKKPSSAYQSYLDSYSNGQIDLEHPPLPPSLSPLDFNHLDPTHHFFSAPLPHSESSRQKILNRLAYHQSPITSSSSSSSSDPFTLSPTDTAFSSSSLSSPSTSHSYPSFAYLQDLYLRPRLDSNHNHMTTTSTTTDLNNSISNPIQNRLSFSLIDHPDLHTLVEKCRALFSVTASMVSMLDDDRNVYLAENGLNGITSVRRDLSFCSHTILNGDRVFAVLDTSVDWRFKNPPTLEHQATRFYAGAPIFAPHLPGLIDSPPSHPSCIGTICVVDIKPRQDFSIQERESLSKFATQCQSVISNWFLDKINQKIKRLDSINLSNWVHNSSSSTQQSNQNQLIPISSNVLNVEEEEENQKGITSLDPTNPSTKSIGGFPFLHNSSTTSSSIYKTFRNKKSNSSTIQSITHSIQDSSNQESLNKKPYESPSPSQIAKFDLATKILAETLELSMVYLVAVLPTNKLIHLNSNEKGSFEILIISSHNVPTPEPILDYDLHLESIRKGSQGLIFNQLPNHNPLPPIHETTRRLKTDHKATKEEEEWNEVQAFAYDRKFEICLRERRRLKSIKENGLNKSGILLLIGEEKEMKLFRVSDKVRKRKTNLGLRLDLDLDLDLKKEDIPKEEEEEIEELEENGDGEGEEEDREIQGGFVIEGYSLDPKRVLGLEDLVYFQHFSKELEKDLNALYDSHCF